MSSSSSSSSSRIGYSALATPNYNNNKASSSRINSNTSSSLPTTTTTTTMNPNNSDNNNNNNNTTVGSNNAVANTNTTTNASSVSNTAVVAAVPTLRVMRLQNPEIFISSSSLNDNSVLHNSFSLPDSLLVYVGETFTAYLGIFNHAKIDSNSSILRKVTISAQLQTPNHRHQLSTILMNNNNNTNNNNNNNNLYNANEILPGHSIDTIVSRKMEEFGQHILRVEVSYYQGNNDNTVSTSSTAAKTFRKFYRFHVIEPFHISIDNIIRFGDTKCYVSMTVMNHTTATTSNNNNNDDTAQQQQQPYNPNAFSSAATPLMISSVIFEAANGLSATMIDSGSSSMKCHRNNEDKTTTTTNDNDGNENNDNRKNTNDNDINNNTMSAVQLFDSIGGGTRIRTSTTSSSSSSIVVNNNNNIITSSSSSSKTLGSNNNNSSNRNITTSKSNSNSVGNNSPTVNRRSPHNNTNNNNSSTNFLFPNTNTTTSSLLSISSLSLSPATYRYCFQIDACDNDTIVNGISSGDLLGRVLIVWKKAMGETGTVSSPTIYCPKVSLFDTTTSTLSSLTTSTNTTGKNVISNSNITNNNNNNNNTSTSSIVPSFVVYRSGLTIDVAASAMSLSKITTMSTTIPKNTIRSLANQYPITIEPINPPSQMKLNIPIIIKFLIINHSENNIPIQIQFRTSTNNTTSATTTTQLSSSSAVTQPSSSSLSLIPSIQVCGNDSYYNIDEILGNGGSRILNHIQFIPLMTTGICTLSGCYIINLITGHEIQIPPLFTTFVTL